MSAVTSNMPRIPQAPSRKKPPNFIERLTYRDPSSLDPDELNPKPGMNLASLFELRVFNSKTGERIPAPPSSPDLTRESASSKASHSPAPGFDLEVTGIFLEKPLEEPFPTQKKGGVSLPPIASIGRRGPK